MMTSLTPECPACRVKMEPGFVLDVGHNQNFPTRWAEGTPEKSFFKSLKVKGRKLDTVTFRCPKCGWLIWFAPEAGDPEP